MRWLKRYSFPLLLFLSAWGVRLLPVLLTRSLGIGLDDMFQYDMLARSLASGNGFRWYALPDLQLLQKFIPLVIPPDYNPRGVLTSFRAPLYPVLLSLVYRLSGAGDGRFFAARLFQSWLAAFLPLLTWLLGRELGDERAARRAAWVIAFYPMFIAFPLALATENLFFPLVSLSLFLLLRLQKRPSLLLAALSGLVLGLAALTRSVILPLAALGLLWIAFDLRLWRHALLAGLTLALTVLPWVVRNSLLYGRPVGIEPSLGYNLYVGYHPQSSGTFTFGPSLDLLTIVDDLTRDRVGTQKALEFIRQQPLRFPYLVLRRLGHFFDPEWRAFTYFYTNDILGPLPLPLLVLIYLLLSLPFMVIALSLPWGWLTLPPGATRRLLFLAFLGYLTPHLLILSEERFHLTLLPLFSLLAVRLWRRGSAVPRPPASAAALGVAALATIALLSYWTVTVIRFWPLLLRILSPGGNRLGLPY